MIYIVNTFLSIYTFFNKQIIFWKKLFSEVHALFSYYNKIVLLLIYGNNFSLYDLFANLKLPQSITISLLNSLKWPIDFFPLAFFNKVYWLWNMKNISDKADNYHYIQLILESLILAYFLRVDKIDIAINKTRFLWEWRGFLFLGVFFQEYIFYTCTTRLKKVVLFSIIYD